MQTTKRYTRVSKENDNKINIEKYNITNNSNLHKVSSSSSVLSNISSISDVSTLSNNSSAKSEIYLQKVSSGSSNISEIGLKKISSNSSNISDVSEIGLKKIASNSSNISDVSEIGLKKISSNSSNISDVSEIGLKKISSNSSNISDVSETGLKKISSNSSNISDVSEIGLKKISSNSSNISDVSEIGLKKISSNSSNISDVSEIGLKKISSNSSNISDVSEIGLKKISSNSSNISDVSETGLKKISSNSSNISDVSETGLKKISSNSSNISDVSEIGLKKISSNSSNISDVSEIGLKKISSNSSNISDVSEIGLKKISSNSSNISDVSEIGLRKISSNSSNISDIGDSLEAEQNKDNEIKVHTIENITKDKNQPTKSNKDEIKIKVEHLKENTLIKKNTKEINLANIKSIEMENKKDKDMIGKYKVLIRKGTRDLKSESIKNKEINDKELIRKKTKELKSDTIKKENDKLFIRKKTKDLKSESIQNKEMQEQKLLRKGTKDLKPESIKNDYNDKQFIRKETNDIKSKSIIEGNYKELKKENTKYLKTENNKNKYNQKENDNKLLKKRTKDLKNEINNKGLQKKSTKDLKIIVMKKDNDEELIRKRTKDLKTELIKINNKDLKKDIYNNGNNVHQEKDKTDKKIIKRNSADSLISNIKRENAFSKYIPKVPYTTDNKMIEKYDNTRKSSAESIIGSIQNENAFVKYTPKINVHKFEKGKSNHIKARRESGESMMGSVKNEYNIVKYTPKIANVIDKGQSRKIKESRGSDESMMGSVENEYIVKYTPKKNDDTINKTMTRKIKARRDSGESMMGSIKNEEDIKYNQKEITKLSKVKKSKSAASLIRTSDSKKIKNYDEKISKRKRKQIKSGKSIKDTRYGKGFAKYVPKRESIVIDKLTKIYSSKKKSIESLIESIKNEIVVDVTYSGLALENKSTKDTDLASANGLRSKESISASISRAVSSSTLTTIESNSSIAKEKQMGRFSSDNRYIGDNYEEIGKPNYRRTRDGRWKPNRGVAMQLSGHIISANKCICQTSDYYPMKTTWQHPVRVTVQNCSGFTCNCDVSKCKCITDIAYCKYMLQERETAKDYKTDDKNNINTNNNTNRNKVIVGSLELKEKSKTLIAIKRKDTINMLLEINGIKDKNEINMNNNNFHDKKTFYIKNNILRNNNRLSLEHNYLNSNQNGKHIIDNKLLKNDLKPYLTKLQSYESEKVYNNKQVEFFINDGKLFKTNANQLFNENNSQMNDKKLKTQSSENLFNMSEIKDYNEIQENQKSTMNINLHKIKTLKKSDASIGKHLEEHGVSSEWLEVDLPEILNEIDSDSPQPLVNPFQSIEHLRRLIRSKRKIQKNHCVMNAGNNLRNASSLSLVIANAAKYSKNNKNDNNYITNINDISNIEGQNININYIDDLKLNKKITNFAHTVSDNVNYDSPIKNIILINKAKTNSECLIIDDKNERKKIASFSHKYELPETKKMNISNDNDSGSETNNSDKVITIIEINPLLKNRTSSINKKNLDNQNMKIYSKNLKDSLSIEKVKMNFEMETIQKDTKEEMNKIPIVIRPALINNQILEEENKSSKIKNTSNHSIHLEKLHMEKDKENNTIIQNNSLKIIKNYKSLSENDEDLTNSIIHDENVSTKFESLIKSGIHNKNDKDISITDKDKKQNSILDEQINTNQQFITKKCSDENNLNKIKKWNNKMNKIKYNQDNYEVSKSNLLGENINSKTKLIKNSELLTLEKNSLKLQNKEAYNNSNSSINLIKSIKQDDLFNENDDTEIILESKLINNTKLIKDNTEVKSITFIDQIKNDSKNTNEIPKRNFLEINTSVLNDNTTTTHGIINTNTGSLYDNKNNQLEEINRDALKSNDYRPILKKYDDIKSINVSCNKINDPALYISKSDDKINYYYPDRVININNKLNQKINKVKDNIKKDYYSKVICNVFPKSHPIKISHEIKPITILNDDDEITKVIKSSGIQDLLDGSAKITGSYKKIVETEVREVETNPNCFDMLSMHVLGKTDRLLSHVINTENIYEYENCDKENKDGFKENKNTANQNKINNGINKKDLKNKEINVKKEQIEKLASGKYDVYTPIEIMNYSIIDPIKSKKLLNVKKENNLERTKCKNYSTQSKDIICKNECNKIKGKTCKDDTKNKLKMDLENKENIKYNKDIIETIKPKYVEDIISKTDLKQNICLPNEDDVKYNKGCIQKQTPELCEYEYSIEIDLNKNII